MPPVKREASVSRPGLGRCGCSMCGSSEDYRIDGDEARNPRAPYARTDAGDVHMDACAAEGV